jgi:hypothetical protein
MRCEKEDKTKKRRRAVNAEGDSKDKKVRIWRDDSGRREESMKGGSIAGLRGRKTSGIPVIAAKW